MGKQFICCNLLLLIGSGCLCFGSLGEIGTQALFKRETWDQQKPKVVDQLKTNGSEFRQALRLKGLKLKKLDLSKMPLSDLKFERGKIKKCPVKDSDFRDTVFVKEKFENIDFSGMNLKNARFIKCKFIDCNFKGSDLRQATFEDSIFKEQYSSRTSSGLELAALSRCQRLHGALLSDDLIFDGNRSHKDLLYDYSDWMKKYKELRGINPTLAATYHNKTIGLNKILGCLSLYIQEATLSDLDLSNIKLLNVDFLEVTFERINFTDASLKKATISNCGLWNIIFNNTKLKIRYFWIDEIENFKSVYFSETLKNISWEEPYDETSLIEEDKQIYKNLYHNRFRFDYDPNQPRIWHYKDLHNTYLCNAELAGKDMSYSNLKRAELPEDLQGTNFTGADLRDVSFQGCDLEGAILVNAKWGENSLFNCKSLKRAQLTENIWVPDYPEEDHSELFYLWINGPDEVKEAYQKIFNLGFDLAKGVPKSKLAKVKWQGKNLENASLAGGDLEGLNLSGSNLKKAYLFNSILNRANFEKANLKKAFMNQSHLNGANLKDANLKNAMMLGTDLRGANLRGANLQGAYLSGARLSDQYTLSKGGTNDILISCYNSCEDPEAKWMLTQILVGKKLLPKNLLNIKQEEPGVEEPPAKRTKVE